MSEKMVIRKPAQYTEEGAEILRFLLARRDFLEVAVMELGEGRWDVVLRLDGTYFGEAFVSKEETVRFFASEIDRMLTEGAEAP